MDAFSVRVTYADGNRLGLHTWGYYERYELFVGASSRFVHALKAAHIDSFELATQFRDAIVAREHGKGDLDFEAEVEEVSANYQGFAESIEKDSKAVRAYLEKHGYPKPGSDPVPPVRSGWVIRVEGEKLPGVCYLLSMVNNGFQTTSDLGRAKCYKTNAYAQKALVKLNAVPNITAVAISLEHAK
jgi:hypothetical protein